MSSAEEQKCSHFVKEEADFKTTPPQVGTSKSHGIKRPADEVEATPTERPKKQVKFDQVSLCLQPATEVWNWTRDFPVYMTRDGPAPVDPTILSDIQRKKVNKLIKAFTEELDTDNRLFAIEIKKKQVICKDLRMIRGLEHACENLEYVEFYEDCKLSIARHIVAKITANTTVAEFQKLVTDFVAVAKPHPSQLAYQVFYAGRCGYHALLVAVEEGNKELVKYILELAGCDANRTKLIHLFILYCFVNRDHNISPWRLAVAAAVNEPENQTRQDILAMLEPYSY